MAGRRFECTGTVFSRLVIQQTPRLMDFDERILEVSVRISRPKEDLCHFTDDDQALADRLDLLRSGVSPNLIFVLKDRSFPVHRQVLIPQSEVFKRMFENKMSESETRKIVIKDATAEIFDIFLKLLYTGSYPEEFEENAVPLFILADKYEVKSLKQPCTVHFENMNIDHTSAKTLLYLACKYPCLEKLEERFVRYLRDHRNYLESQDWKEIEEEDHRAAIDILKLYARRSPFL